MGRTVVSFTVRNVAIEKKSGNDNTKVCKQVFNRAAVPSERIDLEKSALKFKRGRSIGVKDI